MKKLFLNLLMIFPFLQIFTSDFQYFSSPCKANQIDQKEEIQLLTWNILGLPNDQVAVRSWEERIDGIANKILSIDAHVVILQECFVPDLSLNLQQKLSQVYPHAYLHLESSTPLPSGLAVFSKMPITNFRFLPHPDLLDSERNSKMGTIAFVLLNEEKEPIAHIAASHFQGSSNCQWRVGLTETGERLSYEEVRQQEASVILNLSIKEEIPHYVCGDLNVDRRSTEYETSLLNAIVTPSLSDKMNASMKLIGTNTCFWKHEKGIAQFYPNLTQNQTLDLALRYKKIYEEQLKSLLKQDIFNKDISNFDISYFDLLEEKLDLSSEEDQMIWEYFKDASIKAINKEKNLWKANQNEGENPQVSIAKVIEIRALPIEESLDYVLGINPSASVQEVTILQGYEDKSVENTLSDHHPVLATIKIAVKKDRPSTRYTNYQK